MAVTVTAPSIPSGTAVRAYPAESVELERIAGRVPFVTAASADGTVDATHQVSITASAGDYQLLAVVDEIQTITVSATGGQWKATFQGQQTTDIAYNVSAANLKSALAALSNLDAADLTVTGGPGDATGTAPYVITFGGQWAGQNVSAITTQAGTSPLTGTGTAVVATSNDGAGTISGGPIWTRFTIDP